MWGLCVSLSEIHHPEVIVRTLLPPSLKATGTEAGSGGPRCGDVGTAVGWLSASPSSTSGLDAACGGGRGVEPTGTTWQARCSLLGHAFRAELPRGAVVANTRNNAWEHPSDGDGRGPFGGLEQDLSCLKGAEAHAYLQCGISTLRRAFADGGDGGDGPCVLEVDVFRCASGGSRASEQGFEESPKETAEARAPACRCKVRFSALEEKPRHGTLGERQRQHQSGSSSPEAPHRVACIPEIFGRTMPDTRRGGRVGTKDPRCRVRFPSRPASRGKPRQSAPETLGTIEHDALDTPGHFVLDLFSACSTLDAGRSDTRKQPRSLQSRRNSSPGTHACHGQKLPSRRTLAFTPLAGEHSLDP